MVRQVEQTLQAGERLSVDVLWQLWLNEPDTTGHAADREDTQLRGRGGALGWLYRRS